MGRGRARRPWGVEQERKHPRDDRGRFAKKGGQKWAGRVVAGFVAGFGDISAHQGGGPQGRSLGRGPSGLIDVKGIHGEAKQQANIKKILAEYEQGQGGKLTRLEDIQFGAEVKDHGSDTWREVQGWGGAGDKDYVLVRDATGKPEKIFRERGGVFMVRQKEPLRAEVMVDPQAEREMDAWRADAAKPPPFTIKRVTQRDRQIELYEGYIADNEAKASKTRQKLVREARKHIPNGYYEDAAYERQSRKRYVDERMQYDYNVSQADYYRGEMERLRTADNPLLDQETFNGSSAVPTGPVDSARPLAVYGDMLHAADYSQASHRALSDLSKIPAELHQIVAAEMFVKRHNQKRSPQSGEPGVFVGSVSVSELDHLDDLKGERPRGWGEKDTWDDVDGVFRPGTMTIAVGHTANADHRDHSAAEHEFGHALDQALGNVAMRENPLSGDRRASLSPEFEALHKRMAAVAGPGINPYFLQPGDAGPVEFFAEAFAVWGRRMSRLKSPQGQPKTIRHLAANAIIRKFDLKDEQVALDIHDYFLRLTKAAGVDWGNTA